MDVFVENDAFVRKPVLKFAVFLTCDDCIEHTGKSFEGLTIRGKKHQPFLLQLLLRG